MKLVALILIAGLVAYAQHGHGGGVGHAGGAPLGAGEIGPAGGIHGNAGTSERSRMGGTEGRLAEHQSPETILERNTKLSSKLDGLLPTGTTARQACSGFKNLGDCVSAIHVSHNLEVPFDELKGKLTGSSPEKLGKVIHDLKPDVNAKDELKKAHKQAKSDIDEKKGSV